MKSLLFATLLAIGYSQDQCIWTANNGNYVFNLTQISRWTLELEAPDHFYYYTPCRNGLSCHQGNANFHANTAQFKQGANQCEHYLSVDHHESAMYSFIGGSWRFQYADGQLCDQTQQPRRTNVYFHCDDVTNTSPARLDNAYEQEMCTYHYGITSTLACVPENTHNSNCQWRVPDGSDGYNYLDLSELKGEVIHGTWMNGYEMYYSVCSNNLQCHQQHQSTVMSVIDNRQTGTCEHTLAVWENGMVQPLLHQNTNELHWTFHYWNGETCSNGAQNEEYIRWFCDEDVDTYKVLGVGSNGNCHFEMNISSKAACLTTEPKWMDAKALFN